MKTESVELSPYEEARLRRVSNLLNWKLLALFLALVPGMFLAFTGALLVFLYVVRMR